MKPLLCLSCFLMMAGSAFAKHPESPAQTLAERYDKLSCAVVQITFDGGTGTGFFINANGDVLTAAHVALNRVFSDQADGQTKMDINYKPGLRIIHEGKPLEPLSLPTLLPTDVLRAKEDLAILRTGQKTDCSIPLDENPSDTYIGRHVIAIAYPLSVPSSALYEGFISARYQNLPIPIATVNNKPIYPTYDVLRIQMPSTTGASGGPIIGDDGRAIGVLTENPVFWSNDLNALIQLGGQQEGVSNSAASEQPKMLAKLAWVMKEFLTSGAGFAVPVSYLEGQGQKQAQSERPKAPPRAAKPCRLGSLFGCYQYPTH
ncbi:MAG: serine protease [Acidobacteriota bacterium]|nr:serine protease [Acidobacteriota bacterium]